jgi:hypothetical protein
MNMSWPKICVAAAIIVFVLGIIMIESPMADDFELSDTWILTEEFRGCGDNRTETITAEITQKGNSVTIVLKERDRTVIGKIYNNEILCAGIRKVTQAHGAIAERSQEIRDYRLKISEDGNTLTGKSKWFFKTSDFSCNGVSNLTYKRK